MGKNEKEIEEIERGRKSQKESERDKEGDERGG